MKALALLALIFGISNANAQTDTCEALKTRLAKLELAESKLEPIQSKLFKAKAALYTGEASLVLSLLTAARNEFEGISIGSWGGSTNPLTRKVTLTIAALSAADIITTKILISNYRTDMNNMIAETAETIDGVKQKELKVRNKLEAYNCK